MSDDERQAQRKFDRRADSGTGPTSPIEAIPAAPDATPQGEPGPDEQRAQVKAVAPFVTSPAELPTEAPAVVLGEVPGEGPLDLVEAALDPAEVPVTSPGEVPPDPTVVAHDPADTPSDPVEAPPDPTAQVKAVALFAAPPVAPLVPSPKPVALAAASPPLGPLPPSPPPTRTRAESAPDAASEGDSEDATDDEPDIQLTFAARLRRLSPALVILSILSIGSLVFLAFAMTSHTTPVPVLLSSAVVVGLAFGVDTVVASFMTWHAGQNGEGGRALLLALVGGTSAVIAAGAFAGTLILVLLLKS